MKKTLTTFILTFAVTGILLAQLRLNVAGNAAIQGNLNLGNPEGTITGLDMLEGLNDLRFSADAGVTEHMRLTDIGYLGIGTTTPSFRLEVFGETQTAIGLTNTSAGGKAYGLYSLGASNGEGAGHFMIRDETAGVNRFFINTDGNVGIGTIQPTAEKFRVVTDAAANYAIRADNANTAGPEQLGMISAVTGAGTGTRIGIYATVATGPDAADGQHYGVYGSVASENASNLTIGVLGVNTASGSGTHFAGYFSGDVTVTGTFDNSSDEKLKKNIRSLDDAMDRVMSLNPVSYEFRTRDFPQMQLAEGSQLGFIAQEVEMIFPELVKDNKHPELPKTLDENGNAVDYYPALDYKALNYIGLIPVLTRATQEQQEKIVDLEAELAVKDRRISDLEDRMARMELALQRLTEAENTSSMIPLSDASLLQNQPNPFTETTTINYNIPTAVRLAVLQVTDSGGRLIKTIRIDQRGEGQTILEARSLSAGTYFYTLLLDDVVQDTKKMVLTRQ